MKYSDIYGPAFLPPFSRAVDKIGTELFEKLQTIKSPKHALESYRGAPLDQQHLLLFTLAAIAHKVIALQVIACDKCPKGKDCPDRDACHIRSHNMDAQVLVASFGVIRNFLTIAGPDARERFETALRQEDPNADAPL